MDRGFQSFEFLKLNFRGHCLQVKAQDLEEKTAEFIDMRVCTHTNKLRFMMAVRQPNCQFAQASSSRRETLAGFGQAF